MISRQASFRRSRPLGAFTLIEILTVIVVMMILASMITGVIMDMRSRAERAACVTNLKSLYTGAAAYVNQYGSWPQIDPTQDGTAYAQAWVAVLQPMGISQINWICPTVQRVLGNQDYTSPANYRVDYTPCPFDDKPMSPYQWPHQPWFVERGSVHGTGGNIMIWANGQIVTLEDAMQYH